MNLLTDFENGKGFVLVKLNSIFVGRDVKVIRRRLSQIMAVSKTPALVEGYYEWYNGKMLHRQRKEYVFVIPIWSNAVITEVLTVCAPYGQARYYGEDIADSVPHALYWFLNDLAGNDGDPADLEYRRIYGTYGGGIEDEIYIFVGEYLTWYAKLIE